MDRLSSHARHTTTNSSLSALTYIEVQTPPRGVAFT